MFSFICQVLICVHFYHHHHQLQPLQPAKQSSSWEPSIVITPNFIDRNNNRQLVEHHLTSLISASVIEKMGATDAPDNAANGLVLSLKNGTSSEKSIATNMTTVSDLNNECLMSIEMNKNKFQNKSNSPKPCRTQSVESKQSSSLFQRSNSMPGCSSSQPNQQLSPRKPNFTSSSFYDPRSHPTIEEQVSIYIY